MRAILLAIALTFLPGPLPGQQSCSWYDHDTRGVSAEEEIFQPGHGTFVLECEQSAVDPSGEETRVRLRGVAFALEVDGRCFYLGAGHAFDLQEAMSTRGFALEDTQIGAPAYALLLAGGRCPLQRIDDGTRDVAIFVAAEGAGGAPRACYPCGDSDRLRVGSPVLSWGMPLMEDFELSTGIVSALVAPGSLVEAAFPGVAAADFFVTSMPTIFGCSGAPVYAFKAGRPEVVGMLVAGYLNINRSIVYRINAILRDGASAMTRSAGASR